RPARPRPPPGCRSTHRNPATWASDAPYRHADAAPPASGRGPSGCGTTRLTAPFPPPRPPHLTLSRPAPTGRHGERGDAVWARARAARRSDDPADGIPTAARGASTAMEGSGFLARVQEQGQYATTAEAERVTRIVLSALGGHLARPERDELAACLRSEARR